MGDVERLPRLDFNLSLNRNGTAELMTVHIRVVSEKHLQCNLRLHRLFRDNFKKNSSPIKLTIGSVKFINFFFKIILISFKEVPLYYYY